MYFLFDVRYYFYLDDGILIIGGIIDIIIIVKLLYGKVKKEDLKIRKFSIDMVIKLVNNVV